MAKFRILYNPTDNVKLLNSQVSLPKGPDELLRTYKTHTHKPQNKTKPTKISLWAWFKFWEYLQRVSKKLKVCNLIKPLKTSSQAITPPPELGLALVHHFIILYEVSF